MSPGKGPSSLSFLSVNIYAWNLSVHDRLTHPWPNSASSFRLVDSIPLYCTWVQTTATLRLPADRYYTRCRLQAFALDPRPHQFVLFDRHYIGSSPFDFRHVNSTGELCYSISSTASSHPMLHGVVVARVLSRQCRLLRIFVPSPPAPFLRLHKNRLILKFI